MKSTLIEKLAVVVIVLVVIAMIFMSGIIIQLATNPEMIGQWFHKIIQGFNGM